VEFIIRFDVPSGLALQQQMNNFESFNDL